MSEDTAKKREIEKLRRTSAALQNGHRGDLSAISDAVAIQGEILADLYDSHASTQAVEAAIARHTEGCPHRGGKPLFQFTKGGAVVSVFNSAGAILLGLGLLIFVLYGGRILALFEMMSP